MSESANPVPGDVRFRTLANCVHVVVAGKVLCGRVPADAEDLTEVAPKGIARCRVCDKLNLERWANSRVPIDCVGAAGVPEGQLVKSKVAKTKKGKGAK